MGYYQCSHSDKVSLITKLVSVTFFLTCVELNAIYGLQSSVLADLKQVDRASGSRISSKVKRAQEVVMFGNQQNKLSDQNYVRADKRDILNIPAPDVQNNLDKDELEEPIAMASIDPNPSYPQLSALRGRFYYDQPDTYDPTLYEDRQKRNVVKRLRLNRSDRVFRSFDENSRTKRESQLNQLNPDELLSLLMWELQQQQQHHHKQSPHWRSTAHNNKHLEYDPYSNENLDELETQDNSESEEWLNSPVPLHHLTGKPRFYPPYLIPNRQTRNYNKNADTNYPRALSKLSAENGQYDQRGFPQRKYLL